MAQSMHDVSDPRNASILININGELKPRAEAVVSVFDSGFMLGDGVWEGLRVHKGRLAFLDRHLDRLFEGAKAIAMDIGLSRDQLTKRLYDTLDANGMSEGAHVRLMVTRGVRSTPYQDPRVVVTPATVVITAEYKDPDPAVYERGLKLFTVHVRRGGITRSVVLEIARDAGIPAIEKTFSLTDVYGADEAFVTGTFAGIVPVREIDGRKLICRGPMVERLQHLYTERVERDIKEQQRP